MNLPHALTIYDLNTGQIFHLDFEYNISHLTRKISARAFWQGRHVNSSIMMGMPGVTIEHKKTKRIIDTIC